MADVEPENPVEPEDDPDVPTYAFGPHEDLDPEARRDQLWDAIKDATQGDFIAFTTWNDSVYLGQVNRVEEHKNGRVSIILEADHTLVRYRLFYSDYEQGLKAERSTQDTEDPYSHTTEGMGSVTSLRWFRTPTETVFKREL